MSVLPCFVSRSSRRGTLVLLVCGLLTAGCGGSDTPIPVKVSGVVEYKGKPLSSGSVMFNPEDPKTGRIAQGKIQPDGSFALGTFKDGDGALAGSYTVTVTSTLPGTETLTKDKGTGIGGKSAIPDRYADAKISPLKETIDDGDAGKLVTLDLND